MIEMHSKNKIFNSRGERHLGHFKSNEEALICLDCDLPDKFCNRDYCQRYSKMIKKLKKGKEYEKKGKAEVSC